jgi:hypothetical protein
MSVRLKVTCSAKDDAGNLSFSAVTSGSQENQQFFQATPSGQITFQTVNKQAADQFEQGKEYYVDLSSAG